MCHRTGVQPLQPTGQGWDYGIGVSQPAGVAARPRAAQARCVCLGPLGWYWPGLAGDQAEPSGVPGPQPCGRMVSAALVT